MCVVAAYALALAAGVLASGAVVLLAAPPCLLAATTHHWHSSTSDYARSTTTVHISSTMYPHHSAPGRSGCVHHWQGGSSGCGGHPCVPLPAASRTTSHGNTIAPPKRDGRTRCRNTTRAALVVATITTAAGCGTAHWRASAPLASASS